MRCLASLTILLVALSSVGCTALVGQRYASDTIAPTGGLLRHGGMMGGEVVHADYVSDGYAGTASGWEEPGCASCSGGHQTVMAPRVRHSCDDRKQCTPYCDRCEGNSAMPLAAMEGMPLLHRIKSRLVCGEGCGEVYIGEWISTPPTPDPCDNCATFTGECNSMMYRPHQQPVRQALSLIAGVRDADTGCGCGEVDCEQCDSQIHRSYDYQQAPFVQQPSCNCGGH